MREIVFCYHPNSFDDASSSSGMENEKLKNYEARLQVLWDKYKEKQKAYQDAELEYNNLRKGALTANSTQAVTDWSLNANLYRDKVKGALDDWVVAGCKNEVEMMLAYIQQIKYRK
jgi:hypothetical protein